MAIAFTCPSCDKAYTVDEKFAGRRTNCKQCKGWLTVPELPAADEFEVLDGGDDNFEVLDEGSAEAKPPKLARDESVTPARDPARGPPPAGP